MFLLLDVNCCILWIGVVADRVMSIRSFHSSHLKKKKKHAKKHNIILKLAQPLLILTPHKRFFSYTPLPIKKPEKLMTTSPASVNHLSNR